MAVTIFIPTPLQNLTKNAPEVTVSGASVEQILEDLNKKFPGFKEKLFDNKGQLRRFINFYLNDQDIRFLSGIGTKVKDGDALSIVPAIAGG